MLKLNAICASIWEGSSFTNPSFEPHLGTQSWLAYNYKVLKRSEQRVGKKAEICSTGNFQRTALKKDHNSSDAVWARGISIMVQNLQYTPHARPALGADKSAICLPFFFPLPRLGSLMHKINAAKHS